MRNDEALLIAPFIDFESEVSRPLRVARQLASICNVTVVTTIWDHARKQARSVGTPDWAKRVILVGVPHYQRNIGFRRALSHAVFTAKVGNIVRATVNDYRMIYATAPLSSAAATAFNMGAHCRKILDVVDIWPDTLPFPPYVRTALYPLMFLWKRSFIRAARAADTILTVSESFREQTEEVLLEPGPNVNRVYLGQKKLLRLPKNPKRPLTIALVGNLGRLCDLETLLAAVASGSIRGRTHLVIVGRGDRKEWLKSRLPELQISFEMPEPTYSQTGLSEIFSRCNIGFNGYVNTTASFSYKATTYFAAGLPIVNSMGGDLRKLIECRGIGVNYRSMDAESLIEGLVKLDPAMLTQLSKNAEEFFEQELEGSVVDERIRSILLKEYNRANR